MYSRSKLSRSCSLTLYGGSTNFMDDSLVNLVVPELARVHDAALNLTESSWNALKASEIKELPFLERLDLGLGFNSRITQTSEIPLFSSASMPRLSVLCLRESSLLTLKSLAHQTLRSLSFTWPVSRGGAKDLAEILQMLPSLQNLRLQNVGDDRFHHDTALVSLPAPKRQAFLRRLETFSLEESFREFALSVVDILNHVVFPSTARLHIDVSRDSDILPTSDFIFHAVINKLTSSENSDSNTSRPSTRPLSLALLPDRRGAHCFDTWSYASLLLWDSVQSADKFVKKATLDLPRLWFNLCSDKASTVNVVVPQLPDVVDCSQVTTMHVSLMSLRPTTWQTMFDSMPKLQELVVGQWDTPCILTFLETLAVRRARNKRNSPLHCPLPELRTLRVISDLWIYWVPESEVRQRMKALVREREAAGCGVLSLEVSGSNGDRPKDRYWYS